jgi:hypothetical protein
VWFYDGFSFFFVAEFKQGDNNTEDVTGSGIGGVVRKVASDRELNRLL